MYANVFARSALRSRVAGRQLARSDLFHFENTNGQVIPPKFNLLDGAETLTIPVEHSFQDHQPRWSRCQDDPLPRSWLRRSFPRCRLAIVSP